MENIKKISIKEFREKGYLQELNRMFLHPLGLALEVIIDKNGEESLGGIWDYREDGEGIVYDLISSNPERIKNFTEKAKFVQNEFNKRKFARNNLLNSVVEKIPGYNE